MNDSRELSQKVETCLNEGRYLTRWEENFLESLNDKLTLGQPISEREREKLEQIYTEKVA